MNLPLNWDFVFCALGFARNVFGVFTIFTSQNHFCICRGIFLLEKLWASWLAQGLGLCWILFLGSTSCNFSDFWYVLHVQDLSEECFNLFGFLFLTYYVLE